MTASVVSGIAVLADEPTAAPLTDRAGNTVYWQRTRTLLLEDGSTVYGCADCDYTSPNMLSIRPHLGAHTTRPRKAPRGKRDIGGLSIDELAVLAGQMQTLAAELATWKARARKAERALETMRKALAG